MGKNWKTTIFGAVAGLAALLHSQGVRIGHIGSGDAITVAGSLAALLLGLYAADASKGGGGLLNR